MSRFSDRLLYRTLRWWDTHIIRHPWLVILFFVAASGATAWYTSEHLKVNTNTADMISTEVPFQQNRIRLETAFPQDVNTILLLVEGQTPEATSAAVENIAKALRADPWNFRSVYVPDEGEFFARNGLLYLDSKDLDELATQLANAQPFIGRIAEDNTLRGFLGIVGDALSASSKDDFELDLNPLLVTLTDAVTAASQDRPYRASWRRLMMPEATGLGVTQRFIIIAPVFDYQELMPAEKAIAALDRITSGVIRDAAGTVTVRKTGEPILEFEEMQTLSTGVSVASAASMILVCLTLWFAYRSVKLMFATFVSLSMGLIFSLGFATVAIGQLNLISIGFAVLFIGMGDAYSSHFCLRYRELVLRGQSQARALQGTLTSTGSSLILSAITAAIGLYAYIPTSYSGVAELGIIAGTSMFIALATTFTVLPALMKIMPIRPPKKPVEEAGSFLTSDWPLRYARTVQIVTIVLAILAAKLLTGVQVDFNPINLRDPDSESVKTFKYLLESQDTSPMTLASLATSPEQVRTRQAEFARLPTVDKVLSVFDLVPADQDEKLTLIGDLATVLGPQFARFPAPGKGGATRAAVEKFQASVRSRLRAVPDDAILRSLDDALDHFLSHLDQLEPETRQAALDDLQASLLDPLPATIRELQQSLSAEPITLDTLPSDLKARWVSPSGLYRLQIFPKKDLNDLNNLREFILEVQKVDPDVTDLPVSYLESMNEVIKAFQQAFAIAFLATTIILLLVLRSIKDTLLVLLPLLLASLFTAAATVLLKIPFNFANIIALPLLFGLGVDSGIHMAHRLHYLRANDRRRLLGTSEAKGVFYGALTTVFSFCSLALTSHRGTASMGLLLAVGLMLTLICALVVLPAFSTLRFAPRDR